jgi:perosamine synthetase
MCGATPVIVDVDLQSWCIDPNQIRTAVSENTKALIAVDNYGALADIEEIKRHLPSHVPVIEDAAESFPSYPEERCKKFKGDLVTTSFYANKVVTSAEGGAVIGPIKHIAKIDSLKNSFFVLLTLVDDLFV